MVPESMICAMFCNEVLLDPVTNICGHTACQHCWHRYRQGPQASLCPTCRAPMNYASAVNITLRDIVEQTCPLAVQQRRQEVGAVVPLSQHQIQFQYQGRDLRITLDTAPGDNVEQLGGKLFEELGRLGIVEFDGIQLELPHQVRVRVMPDDHEPHGRSPISALPANLTFRIVRSNQDRINSLNARNNLWEVEIMQKMAVVLDQFGPDYVTSQSLDELEDYVTAVEGLAPEPLRRGAKPRSPMHYLVELLESKFASPDLPQLIRQLKEERGLNG